MALPKLVYSNANKFTSEQLREVIHLLEESQPKLIELSKFELEPVLQAMTGRDRTKRKLRNASLVWRALFHWLHVVIKAVFGHLSPELGSVSTGMPGMYSAPDARIVGFVADFREGMPMTGHAEDRRIHDVRGYFIGTEEVLQDLCC